jgi:hypothetical protein
MNVVVDHGAAACFVVQDAVARAVRVSVVRAAASARGLRRRRAIA